MQEQRVARIETDIAKIQLDVREFRIDMKAANDAIRGVRTQIVMLDGKIETLGQGRIGKANADLQGIRDAILCMAGGMACGVCSVLVITGWVWMVKAVFGVSD